MMARRNLSEAIASRKELNYIFGTGSTEKLSEITAAGDEKLTSPNLVICSFTFVPNSKPIRYYYDPDELEQWAFNDIKPNGVRSPLWVRPHPNQPGHYELVAGLRRLKAANIAGLAQIPIKVFDWDNDTAFQAAVAENSNRQDLNPLEELDNMLRLLEIHIGCEKDEAISILYRMNNAVKGTTNQNVLVSEEAKMAQQLFESYSRITWQSFVSTRLSLLKLPEDILDAARQGKIHYTKAKPISGVKDSVSRQKLLAEAIKNRLSLTEIKQRVRQANGTLNVVESKNNLKQRLTLTLQQIRKNQRLWSDPKQKQKIEKVLSQLDVLLVGSQETK
jgi:ParB family transcriptional regulator, chromosome partitioning protein